MDAPLPPPMIVKSPDCLCKPSCNCTDCKCVAPSVKASGASYTVSYKGRTWTFTAASKEQADGITKELRKLADGLAIPQPMPMFVPGPCPGGVCPVR